MKTVLTVKQTAERLGVSDSLVYELCRSGLIRHSRHGRPGRRGTIRIEAAAVAEYRSACERQPVEDDEGLTFIK